MARPAAPPADRRASRAGQARRTATTDTTRSGDRPRAAQASCGPEPGPSWTTIGRSPRRIRRAIRCLPFMTDIDGTVPERSCTSVPDTRRRGLTECWEKAAYSTKRRRGPPARGFLFMQTKTRAVPLRTGCVQTLREPPVFAGYARVRRGPLGIWSCVPPPVLVRYRDSGRPEARR